MALSSAPSSTAARTDAWIARFLDDAHLPASLDEATRYAVLGPGKRIRPMLVIESCLACGGSVDAALPAAGAVEMIHAFSLVHDDLPALDNDDLRRGLPTTHAKFGEAMGILVGDVLMTLAFRALATVTPGAHAAALTKALAQGATDMVAGQVLDTMGGDVTWRSLQPINRVREVHLKKTAALLRASCVMGGISAGLPDGDPKLQALDTFATSIGLMFQIVDDLLDVEQSQGQVGKRTGKDASAGKLTYPAVLGIDAARAEVAHLEQEALTALALFGPRGDKLGEIARTLARRTH